MRRRACAIYIIENTSTEKIYVGSAIDFTARAWNHFSKLRTNSHHSKKLQNAWNKYGESHFKISVIEYVFLREFLVEREQYWMNSLHSFGPSGYNILPSAGSPLGRTHSEATKRKIASSHLGMAVSPAARLKISKANKGTATFLGKHHSPEALRKISETSKGRTHSQESREKISRSVIRQQKLCPRKRNSSQRFIPM